MSVLEILLIQNPKSKIERFVLSIVHRTLVYCVGLHSTQSRCEASFKRSIRQKSRKAGMNDLYMLTILFASLPTSSSPI